MQKRNGRTLETREEEAWKDAADIRYSHVVQGYDHAQDNLPT